MTCSFTGLGREIFTMIACILGFTTNEYADEITFSFMTIFTPGQPPAAKYDFAAFIADNMHDQFMRLENKRVLKYFIIMYHLFLYYQIDKFPFSVHNTDTKGDPRSVIFWIPIFHSYSPSSPYSYRDFIDQFVHPINTMLIGNSPARINDDIKRIL